MGDSHRALRFAKPPSARIGTAAHYDSPVCPSVRILTTATSGGSVGILSAETDAPELPDRRLLARHGNPRTIYGLLAWRVLAGHRPPRPEFLWRTEYCVAAL